MLDEAVAAVEFLSHSPHFALVDDKELAKLGVRSTSIRNYLIFFVVDEASLTVDVISFMNGRRDWASILKGMTNVNDD